MKLICGTLIVFLIFMSCSTSAPILDKIPEHETFSVESKIIGEKRVINVWTPPNYSNNIEKFMVLYMADGGINEDFPHISNTLSDLIATKKIPPMILVGIENTERRRDRTGATQIADDKKIAQVVGGSKAFRSFIQEELFAVIDKKYRTTEKKGIIGESLSGLFVTETFLEHPEKFDYYIAFDPSLWWNDHFLIKTAKDDLAKFPKEEKRFWFAGSGTKEISEFTVRLEQILKTTDPPNVRWNYSPEPKEEHGTVFRATKEKALIWTFGTQ